MGSGPRGETIIQGIGNYSECEFIATSITIDTDIFFQLRFLLVVGLGISPNVA